MMFNKSVVSAELFFAPSRLPVKLKIFHCCKWTTSTLHFSLFYAQYIRCKKYLPNANLSLSRLLIVDMPDSAICCVAFHIFSVRRSKFQSQIRNNIFVIEQIWNFDCWEGFIVIFSVCCRTSRKCHWKKKSKSYRDSIECEKLITRTCCAQMKCITDLQNI